MLTQLSKGKRILAVIAILSTAIAVMHDLVLIPIYGVLYGGEVYSFDNIGMINYIVSGPALVLVISSLLTGLLMKKINKKIVMISGGVIFAVGAILGGLNVENLVYMCAMRTLVGIGAGVTNVVAVALITDLYVDIDQRAKITGYYNAALSIVGTLFSFFAGQIADAFSWDKVFVLYWSAIPMVVLLILFIPSIKPAQAELSEAGTKIKEPLGWRFWWMNFTFFLFNVVMGATVLYYLSSYIYENGIGTASFAGTAAGVKSIVGFLICLGFGFIYKKLKRHTVTVMYAIAAVTMLPLILAPGVAVVLILGTLCACTYKMVFPYAYAHGSSIVPQSRTGDSASIVTAVYGIGSFISTYYATWLLSAMKSETFTQTWYVNVGVLVVMVIGEIIVAGIEKKKFALIEA